MADVKTSTLPTKRVSLSHDKEGPPDQQPIFEEHHLLAQHGDMQTMYLPKQPVSYNSTWRYNTLYQSGGWAEMVRRRKILNHTQESLLRETTSSSESLGAELPPMARYRLAPWSWTRARMPWSPRDATARSGSMIRRRMQRLSRSARQA